MKKIVAVVLALCLMLSLNAVAFAANYDDVPDGHWAEKAIEEWSKNGIFEGDESGNFNPSAFLKRAEAAAIMARLFKLTEKADISRFTDVEADAWYTDYIALCVAAGILKGTSETTMAPLDNVTREQFFVMFARALGFEEASYSKVVIADDADIADWAKGHIYAMVNGGYLKGTSVNSTTISPKDFINRASVASLLEQTVSLYADASGEYSYVGSGIALIVAPDVTLVNAPAGTTVVTKNAPNAKVNGVSIGENTIYIVPADQGGNGGNSGGIPVIPTKSHAQIIDEAVQDYISRFSYSYAKLTKNAYVIKVDMIDPNVQIGRVYTDIGESMLNALQNQVNPYIYAVKATLDDQKGELEITADKDVTAIHDLVYEVTGFAGNDTIGELDGKTITVSFIDEDKETFVYAFQFATVG